MKGTTHDPRALVQEAYRIEGITAEECRSVFLDWALGVPAEVDPKVWVQELLVLHADQPADHPMTITLQNALESQPTPRRRGGRAGRGV